MSEDIKEMENLEFRIINSETAPSLFVDGVTSVIDSDDVIKISFHENVSSGEVSQPSFRRVNLHLAFSDKNFKKFVRHLNEILERREKNALADMTEAGDSDDKSR